MFLRLYRFGLRALWVIRTQGWNVFIHKSIQLIKKSLGIVNKFFHKKNINIYQDLYKTLDNVSGNQISVSEYVESKNTELSIDDIPVKLIAFYLPQFHPIPENDITWGKGFTEWTNVSKAIPQFVGHYQPRYPGELGYYDLRLPEVQERQVEIARQYGIYGFCFHYYWFEGKHLLDKPLNQFANNQNINFPFCICWANENWTRRWDGYPDDVIIGQTHSIENDNRFIEDLEQYLQNPHYIRINDRPLILVYRPQLLGNPKLSAEYWRKYCLARGLGKPLIVGCQTFGFFNPEPINFDAAVEFPPHNKLYTNINNKITFLNRNFTGNVFEYREMVSKGIEHQDTSFRLFRTVTPSWDNVARRNRNGEIYANSSPHLYRRWLEHACVQEINTHPIKERFVFINAWNEWAECAYLEPDRKYGYAYLQATKDALINTSETSFQNSKREKVLNIKPNGKIGIILHLYYEELIDELIVYLNNIIEPYDVFISIPKSSHMLIETALRKFPNAYFLLTENRGRDIAPFIEIFRLLENLGYKYLLKIHTKKSPQLHNGNIWRKDLYENLLGSPELVTAILSQLRNNPKLGLIGPIGNVLNVNSYLGSNEEIIRKITFELGIPFSDDYNYNFVAGSMFWARTEALNFLNLLPINSLDFYPEPAPTDGTLAHAIERFIGIGVDSLGFTICEIDNQGNLIKNKKERYFKYALPS